MFEPSLTSIEIALFTVAFYLYLGVDYVGAEADVHFIYTFTVALMICFGVK